MKQTWVIANWKSHKTISESLSWLESVGPRIEQSPNTKVIICPVFSSLSAVKEAIVSANYPLEIGSQDISPFGIGAYTGEEPAEILKDLVSLSIIGHSERRKLFTETDRLIAEKANQALKSNILPLVCVQGKDTPVPDRVKLIAYEPVFAIGTGHPDTPEDAAEVASYFKSKASDMIVLYGGSVEPQNAEAFLKQPSIDGFLIGGASLDADKFVEIVKSSQRRS